MTGLLLRVVLGAVFFPSWPLSERATFLLSVLASIALLLTWKASPAVFASRFEVEAIRWLIWLAAALVFAGVTFLSGLGWVAGISRLLAVEQPVTYVSILLNERYETRRTLCVQRILIKIDNDLHWICADDWLATRRMEVGEALAIRSLKSPLGLHVQHLSASTRSVSPIFGPKAR
jgi:hypothetical protein